MVGGVERAEWACVTHMVNPLEATHPQVTLHARVDAALPAAPAPAGGPHPLLLALVKQPVGALLGGLLRRAAPAPAQAARRAATAVWRAVGVTWAADRPAPHAAAALLVIGACATACTRRLPLLAGRSARGRGCSAPGATTGTLVSTAAAVCGIRLRCERGRQPISQIGIQAVLVIHVHFALGAGPSAQLVELERGA